MPLKHSTPWPCFLCWLCCVHPYCMVIVRWAMGCADLMYVLHSMAAHRGDGCKARGEWEINGKRPNMRRCGTCEGWVEKVQLKQVWRVKKWRGSQESGRNSQESLKYEGRPFLWPQQFVEKHYNISCCFWSKSKYWWKHTWKAISGSLILVKIQPERD